MLKPINSFDLSFPLTLENQWVKVHDSIAVHEYVCVVHVCSVGVPGNSHISMLALAIARLTVRLHLLPEFSPCHRTLPLLLSCL